jgi:hypothetical protein
MKEKFNFLITNVPRLTRLINEKKKMENYELYKSIKRSYIEVIEFNKRLMEENEKIEK